MDISHDVASIVAVGIFLWFFYRVIRAAYRSDRTGDKSR